MPLTKIKGYLSDTDKGKIVLLNMEHAIREKHLEEDIVRKLVDTLDSKLQEDLKKNINKKKLSEFIIRNMNKISNAERETYYFNRRQKPSFEQMSCIIDLSTFMALIDTSNSLSTLNSINKLMGNKSDKSGFLFDDAERRSLQDYVYNYIQNKNTRIKSTTLFGNPSTGIFWFTDTEAIKKLEYEFSDDNEFNNGFANAVRDRLGLVHHKVDTLLIEFKMKVESLDDRFLAAPTFIEARDHRRFKAIKDKSNNTDNCAYSADLNKVRQFSRTTDTLDGLKEYVSKEVLLNHDNWEFRIIGFISEHSEAINPNHRDKIREKDARFASVLDEKCNKITV